MNASREKPWQEIGEDEEDGGHGQAYSYSSESIAEKSLDLVLE